MAAILIFKCTEGAGFGDYSFMGRGKKNRGTVIITSYTAAHVHGARCTSRRLINR